MSLSLALNIAALGLVALIVAKVVVLYRKTTGTLWERLKATCYGSLTIFKEYVLLIGGTMLAYSDQALAFLQMPEVQAKLQASVSPETMGWVIVGIAVLGWLTRMRSIWQSWRAS